MIVAPSLMEVGRIEKRTEVDEEGSMGAEVW
jgi:hypothetical protein